MVSAKVSATLGSTRRALPPSPDPLGRHARARAGGEKTSTSQSNSRIRERGQDAVAGGEIAIAAPAADRHAWRRRQVLAQTALDRLGIAPQHHRVDEAVAAAVRQVPPRVNPSRSQLLR